MPHILKKTAAVFTNFKTAALLFVISFVIFFVISAIDHTIDYSVLIAASALNFMARFAGK